MSLSVRSLLGYDSQADLQGLPVSVPVSVDFRPQGCRWALERGRLRYVDLANDEPIPVEQGPKDAWEVRSAFLRVSSADDLLGFLNATGVFSRTGESGLWTVADVLVFQRIVRYLMGTHPSRWRASRKIFGDNQRIFETIQRFRIFSLRFIWTPANHAAAVVATATLEAVLASVHIDALRGARFGFCARSDCGRQYEISSKHNRKYCTYECAHLEAVRRSRLKSRP